MNLFTNVLLKRSSIEIADFGDYLLIKYCEKALPESIYKYESIEHVYSQLLPEAIDNLDDMSFFPESVRKIANSLIMVELCSDDLDISTTDAFEKIFGSIGLKYNTVSTDFSFKTNVKASDTDVSSLFDIINNVTLNGKFQIDYENKNALLDLDKLAGTGDNAEAHKTLVRHGYTNSHSEEYQQIWKNYWWKIRY